jgi:hypothetical protein
MARGPSDGDVSQPPLLLHRAVRVIGVDERPPVRDSIGFEPDEDNGLPLPSLRCVDRRELDTGLGISQRRDPRSRAGERVDESVHGAERGGPAEECIEGGMILIGEQVA